MALAKLRVNPECTDFEIDLPDGSGDSGDYNPGEGAVLIAEDGTPYYLTFDEFPEPEDEPDGPALKPNTLYKLVEVDMLVERGVELEIEDNEEEGEEPGEM